MKFKLSIGDIVYFLRYGNVYCGRVIERSHHIVENKDSYSINIEYIILTECGSSYNNYQMKMSESEIFSAYDFGREVEYLMTKAYTNLETLEDEQN